MEKNFYRLTKKELSFISSIEEPVISIHGERLSRPVVVVTYCGKVLHVWSLSWYRSKVKRNAIFTDTFVYNIHSMY